MSKRAAAMTRKDSEPPNLQQDHYTTAVWHDRYLAACWFFFGTTCLFAGLFGGYYSALHDHPPCNAGASWVFGNDSAFDDACHVVGSDGLYAIDGMPCPTECDEWFHAYHPKVVLDTHRRLLGASADSTKAMVQPKSDPQTSCTHINMRTNMPSFNVHASMCVKDETPYHEECVSLCTSCRGILSGDVCTASIDYSDCCTGPIKGIVNDYKLGYGTVQSYIKCPNQKVETFYRNNKQWCAGLPAAYPCIWAEQCSSYLSFGNGACTGYPFGTRTCSLYTAKGKCSSHGGSVRRGSAANLLGPGDFCHNDLSVECNQYGFVCQVEVKDSSTACPLQTPTPGKWFRRDLTSCESDIGTGGASSALHLPNTCYCPLMD